MQPEIINTDELREKRLIAWQLVNSYRYHSNETGFKEWKDGTPEYVMAIFEKLLATQNNWELF